VNPYLEKVEKKREQVTPIRERVSQEVKELSIKGQEISKDSPILRDELKLSEGKVVNSRHRIKPNRVVEGVMWSEILGQPRSRNPHRPVYAEHFSKRKYLTLNPCRKLMFLQGFLCALKSNRVHRHNRPKNSVLNPLLPSYI
jgi:hypothetical protein